MTWLRIDDGFSDHPKTEAAGNAVVGFVVRCWSYSAKHLLDGFVPEAKVRAYGTKNDIKKAEEVGFLSWGENDAPPDERAAAGNLGRGVWMHDYLDRNPTRAHVEAERQAAAERQRSRRMSRRDTPRDTRRESRFPVPTQPDPTHVSNPPTNSKVVAPDPAGGVDSHTAAIDAAVALERAEATNVGNETGWAKAVRARIERNHGADIDRWLGQGLDPLMAARIATGRQPAPRMDPAEAAARSMVAGLALTGTDPGDIWPEVCSSYPDQADAIADELVRCSGWTPPDAEVVQLRRADTAQDATRGA